VRNGGGRSSLSNHTYCFCFVQCRDWQDAVVSPPAHDAVEERRGAAVQPVMVVAVCGVTDGGSSLCCD
jgi:hypothetical protein